MSRLVIEAHGLHWLNEGPDDLCAHGSVRVWLNCERVFHSAQEDGAFTLSTAALHLLRAIEQDYEPSTSHSGQLIPCCGHLMFFDEALGQVLNCACPHGINWHIQHDRDGVVVTFENDAQIRVSSPEWAAAVLGFSQSVRDFYFATERVVSSDMDQEWHPPFVAEWNSRHFKIAAPPI